MATLSTGRCGALAIAFLLPTLACAELSLTDATTIALVRAPALTAQRESLAAAIAARPAAGELPDPRLTVGVDNFPVSGPGRFALTQDFMTMQRVGVMQEVPNRAKREARVAGAQARVEREKTSEVVTSLGVRRGVELAWLGVYFAERRAALLSDLERENGIVLDTIDARIASGKSMPADRTMARQEALTLADRRDDAQRDVVKARLTLRRWVGGRADEALDGEPPPVSISEEVLRGRLHDHADVAAYGALRAVATAEARQADAEQRGDWAWEVVYSHRGAQYGDMVSFQVSIDLPISRDKRQIPLLLAKQRDVARIDAEREDLELSHREEFEGRIAELKALDAQRERLASEGLRLARERVALTLASYEAGRGDLTTALAARRDVVESRLRLVDLDAQRSALQVRLTTMSEQ